MKDSEKENLQLPSKATIRPSIVGFSELKEVMERKLPQRLFWDWLQLERLSGDSISISMLCAQARTRMDQCMIQKKLSFEEIQK